ncbi:hypothetical protein TA3x_000169 [Tundrisphaera sp. TA3]|uniref:hypothetical protein n=1 Tax=Tundrisphaera sp. TA3 TaxID=3435775 RepID=UPI003EC0CD2E
MIAKKKSHMVRCKTLAFPKQPEQLVRETMTEWTQIDGENTMANLIKSKFSLFGPMRAFAEKYAIRQALSSSRKQ